MGILVCHKGVMYVYDCGIHILVFKFSCLNLLIYSINPDKIYDVFATISYSPTDITETRIESKIPRHYDNEDILKQIPKFAYPCPYER